MIVTTETVGNTRPVIGISTYSEQAKWGAWDTRALLLPRRYADQVAAAGGIPVLLPPFPGIEQAARRLDGLVLAGGGDIDPAEFGAQPHPRTGGVRPDRDAAEFALVAAALSSGLPLLGICRGLQVLNVAMGGSLWQDLNVQVEGTLVHKHKGAYDEVAHSLDIEHGSRLHDAARADRIEVNSRHHQGVHDVAPALTVTARAPDGVAEALEDPARPFLVAVQCHPEDLYAHMDWSRRLFADFARAAARG